MTIDELCQEKEEGLSGRVKLVAFNARYSHSCLALYYLRQALAEHWPEAETEILQLTINDNYFQSLLAIAGDNPRAVLLSAAIWNSDLVERLAIDLRRCLPACPIVIGGPQAEVLGQRLAPGIATIVLGEIEAVPPQFYPDLAAGNLAPRYSGSFLRQTRRLLPYPYKDADFNQGLKNRNIYYESSRGCPYSCTYCLSAAERGVYHKDLDQVRTELGHILSFQPKVLRFVDRTFNDLPARALAIWQYLLDQGGQTLCHFEIAPERFSPEILDFLAKVPAGRFQFEIGIQSTNPETLTAIERHIDPVDAYPLIKQLAELNTIHLHVDLILGLPFETRASFLRSFAATFAMGAHHIQMGLLKILPGTPISRMVTAYGYGHCAQPPYSVFASKWLDFSAMADLYWFSEGVEKFLNNRYFVSLWQYLRRRDEDISAFFVELVDLCRRQGFFQRATTHELLGEMLAKYLADRVDADLLVDLLRYDWLRCGYRQLPTCLALAENAESPAATKEILYQQWPTALAGCYDPSNRNLFFRRLSCLRLSAAALAELGRPMGGSGRLAFLPEREAGLHGHNLVLAVEDDLDGKERSGAERR